MATHYRTQGFVLTKENFRETDQVFSVFCQDFGRINVLAKAIRKIKSKLRSGMGLFYFSEIEFIQGKNFKTLTDAMVIEKFKNMRSDLRKLQIAQKILDASDKLIKGEEKDEKIFSLINETLNRLNNYELRITNYELLYYYFLWNLFSVLGYKTDLYSCSVCQQKLSPTIMNFSPSQNGLICLKCSFDSIKDKATISPETVKILRIIQACDWETFERLKIENQQLEELELVCEQYLLSFL